MNDTEMKHNKRGGSRKIAAVILLCLLPFLLRGAGGEESKGKVLTLKEAVNTAIKSNPSLGQAENQVRLRDVAIKQQKSAFLPDVSASAGYNRTYGQAANQVGEYENSNSTSLNASLSVSSVIFNGFRSINGVRQAKFEKQGAQQTAERSAQSTVFETIRTYAGVLTAAEKVRAEQENLEAQQLQLKRIEDFHQAGKRPVADVYQQKAQISSSQYRLSTALRNHEVYKLMLLQTMGVDPTAVQTGFNAVDPGVEQMIRQVKSFNGQDSLTRALVTRPDLKARQSQIKAAEKEIAIARGGYLPTLSNYISIGTNYNNQNTWANFSEQLFDKNLNFSTGLSLSIPIFDKGLTKTRTTSAKLQLKSQQLELERQKNQVALEVRQAREDFQTAEKQLQAAEAQVEYARAALESIQERYNVNAATLVEVTQARSTTLEANYSLIDARYNVLLKGIAIAYYQGDGQAVMELVAR